jgi:hypothetical protein
VNSAYISFKGCRESFFGFLDMEDDQKVASSLLETVCVQARAKKCNSVLGPIDFSTNDSCGLLTKGFQSPPYAFMPYNYPYYSTLIEVEGFEPAMDLLAYEIDPYGEPESLTSITKRLIPRLARNGITIRRMDFSRFDVEVEALYSIYDPIFSGNWGY